MNMDFNDIERDTVWAVRLMNNKIIHVNGRNIRNYYDDNSVKLIVPALIKFQPEHLHKFYEDYSENLNGPWEERVGSVEEFWEIWGEN